MLGRPEVSVVIPVFEQSRELVACLCALHRQTFPIDLCEVLVIDNGPSDAAATATAWFPFARYLVEVKAGSYAARNCGLRHARGDILAFLDADCVPDEAWLEQGVRAVRRLPGLGLVGGRVDLTYRDPAHLTGAELFERVYGFRQHSYINLLGFSVTANLWTTKDTLREVGPFDDRLFSGGDCEWGQRVTRRFAGLYVDEVRVTHPARRTLRALCQRTRRVAGGLQQLRERRGSGVQGMGPHLVRELVLQRSMRAAPLKATPREWLRFACVSWVVRAVQIMECYRVHYGGTPRRA